MKLLFLLIALFVMITSPAQARYKCEANSATNEVIYYATKMKDNFSKSEGIEFGKSVKKDNSSCYFILPWFFGKGFGQFFLSDEGKIIIDGIPYAIVKDTSAPHVKWSTSGGSSTFAEYCITEDIAEKIKTSKGKIVFLFTLEGRGEKTLDFGLKTSDEIRFIANRTFEDFPAVAKKQLVPNYTEKDD
jgi:hypothetical protein